MTNQQQVHAATDREKLGIVRQHFAELAAPLDMVDVFAQTLARHGRAFEAIAACAAFEQLPLTIRREVRAAISDQFPQAEALLRGDAARAREALAHIVRLLEEE
jgi:hypothetical protein